MRSARRALRALATVVPFAAAMAIPQAAHAGTNVDVWTSDPVLGTGRAQFLSGRDREVLKVRDYRNDDYAVVAYAWALQNDGTWDRKMRVRVTLGPGSDGKSQAAHNIDEGREVRVMVCLEERGYREVYCDEAYGEA